MKKIIVLVVLIIMFGFIIKIPEYHELNDLAIIQGVGVEYKNHSYTVYMKEVIPVRSDMGIDYEFKYYEGESSDLEKAIDIVKKDWGADSTVYFAQDGQKESGEYIICVRDTETTSAKAWYTVNVQTGTFVKE